MEITEKERQLIAYYMQQPNKEATATEAMNALGYSSVIEVSSQVAKLAQKIAAIFSYTPPIRKNGQRRWWPCLFEGRAEKHGFVWKLREEIEAWYKSVVLTEKITAPLQESADERAKRLAAAPVISVPVRRFERNPDVIAQTLANAAGKCQRCGHPAPFMRKSDGSPYLEVHHKHSLSEGGEDSLENTIALCPNCHRELHYGVDSRIVK